MTCLKEIIKIKTVLTLVTGMHIGGNKDTVEIGGIDLPVIKLPSKNSQPYIPGSSLKGKMRCLLEQTFGISQVGDKGNEEECGFMPVRDLFGSAGGNGVARPSRLIVRDAMLTPESEESLRGNRNLDVPYLEYKTENTINRLQGTAEHPRTLERVPAGAEFEVEFVLNIWRDNNSDYSSDKKIEEIPEYKLLKKGMELLENDYLGGNGSRGYGEIKFSPISFKRFNTEKGWQ